jgi:hypothetical protein
MDEGTISLLNECGLSVQTRSVPPADDDLVLPGMAQIERTSVADLDPTDPEDNVNGYSGGADDDSPGVTAYERDRPGRWENSTLVAAAFRAAGSVKFEDVRLRSAKKGVRPDPTHREIAVEQAKRLSRSVSW